MKKILSILTLALIATLSHAETVFHRGNDDEPSTLDPQLAQGMPEMHILRDMFVGLVDEAPNGDIIPGVAENWDFSDDGLTFTFHLRESLWSNNEPLTAEDFVYAWQRAVDPTVGSKYAFFLYPVKNAQAINNGEADIDTLGVKAPDKYTLIVKLERPTPYFLSMLLNAITYPVPKSVIETHGKKWTRPENIVSNGAFTLSEWQPYGHLTLSKAPNYYYANDVALDKIIYYPMQDQNASLKRYRAGELDFTSDVPGEQIKWIKKNLADELHINSYLGTYYFGFNLTKPPFKDNIKLREALTLVVDRTPIVENITASGEIPAYNFVADINGYKPYLPAYTKIKKEERLARARMLYAEAGYSRENPLKVELLYNSSESNKKVSIALAAMWKESLGIETELISKEWKSYLNDRRTYNTQVFRGSWIGDYNDPNTFLDLFVSGTGSNTIGLTDHEFDQLITQAGDEMDIEKRMDLLHQAEQRLLDNYSLIPIYFYVSKHMVKPYVSGYEPNILNHWQSKYIKIAPH